MKANNTVVSLAGNNHTTVSSHGLLQLAAINNWRVTGMLSFGLLVVLLSSVYICMRYWQQYKRRKEREDYVEQLQSDIHQLEANVISLTTKNDWLVTEMHHRVKNNLQILNSLINSQLAFITDKMGRDALLHNKHRVYALSLVHQKLFQSPDANNIEMACCIKELLDYLADEFECSDRIKFELDLISLQLDINNAIPFTLIMNELISNTMKFAFTGRDGGTVKIGLSTDDQHAYRLVFADNGVGLPKDVDFRSGKTLGRNLIIGLSKQIRGTIQVNSNTGLEIIMDFIAPQVQQDRFAV